MAIALVLSTSILFLSLLLCIPTFFFFVLFDERCYDGVEFTYEYKYEDDVNLRSLLLYEPTSYTVVYLIYFIIRMRIIVK